MTSRAPPISDGRGAGPAQLSHPPEPGQSATKTKAFLGLIYPRMFFSGLSEIAIDREGRLEGSARSQVLAAVTRRQANLNLQRVRAGRGGSRAAPFGTLLPPARHSGSDLHNMTHEGEARRARASSRRQRGFLLPSTPLQRGFFYYYYYLCQGQVSFSAGVAQFHRFLNATHVPQRRFSFF
jgi:hypothetical protein